MNKHLDKFIEGKVTLQDKPIKSVVVLGNARSGTSMASGLLSIVGVNMYQSHNPNRGNPKGSFEDVNFIHVTSKMHQDMNRGLNRNQIKDKYLPRLDEIIGKRDGLWGFKSALTHYSLDIILPLLENPHIVVVLRNIYHNAQSYIVHQKDIYGKNISLQHSLRNISDSSKVLIDSVNAANVPKTFVTYEDIKSQPQKELIKLGRFLKIPLTPKMKKDTAQFIMPKYSTLK
jgi:hypothetical protein